MVKENGFEVLEIDIPLEGQSTDSEPWNNVKMTYQTNLSPDAIKIEGDKDGTHYGIIAIPFKGYIGAGYFSTSNGVLIIDTLEKTAYTFKQNQYLSPEYVYEKLIRGASLRDKLDPKYGITDAKNVSYLIEMGIKEIKRLGFKWKEAD